MKSKSIYTALTVILFLFLSPQLKAYMPTSEATVIGQSENNSLDNSELILNKKFKNKRFSKFKMKAQKLLSKVAQKLDIDLQDPVRKWLWYAIIALGAAVILYVLAAILTSSAIYWIAYLASLLSSVSFIIWLLKYLELM